jgi:pimeloyl-ACP methyl ester carboxylesterase
VFAKDPPVGFSWRSDGRKVRIAWRFAAAEPARASKPVLMAPEPILATIRAPVLLLWGERDGAIPASYAAHYKRALPDARTVILPGIGHVPMEEAPEASAQTLRTFLDSEAGG